MARAEPEGAPRARRPTTLKGLLALVGAGLLYLLSQVLGVDLTGSGGEAGAGDVQGGGRPTSPVERVPAERVPAERVPAERAPAQPEPSERAPGQQAQAPDRAPDPAARRDDTELIRQLFRTLTSDRIVEAEGEVVHVLPVDHVGSRHQNFLVELSNGITLKISHNIDLAPEIPGLSRGDVVRFHGEYEYNEKGGVVHWTHRDPAGRHEHGWLEHRGRRYE